MRSGRPWVTLKLAASLDGRTALANGESQWITGEQRARDVQRLRARASRDPHRHRHGARRRSGADGARPGARPARPPAAAGGARFAAAHAADRAGALLRRVRRWSSPATRRRRVAEPLRSAGCTRRGSARRRPRASISRRCCDRLGALEVQRSAGRGGPDAGRRLHPARARRRDRGLHRADRCSATRPRSAARRCRARAHVRPAANSSGRRRASASATTCA